MAAAIFTPKSDLLQNKKNRQRVTLPFKQPQNLLILDFDGTLAPLSPDRENVRPYGGIVDVLNEITESGKTRIAFVTGRPTDQLIQLLGFDGWMEIWGEHGFERRTRDGKVEYFDGSGVLTMVDRVMRMFVMDDFFRRLTRAGLAGHLERKRAGIAVHWRGLPEKRQEEIKQRTFGILLESFSDKLAHVQVFEQGLEFRFTRRSKGDAVNTILKSAPPGARVAYLGDDLTDEPAFQAVEGRGESVLVREEFRPTNAKRWVKPPDELIAYLKQWRDKDGEHV